MYKKAIMPIFFQNNLLLFCINKKEESSNATANNTAKPRILVLGNGYAGTNFITNVSKTKFDVTVIDKNNFMLETHKMTNINSPKKINKCLNNIEYVYDEITIVDVDNKNIKLNNNVLEYDYLVFALGSMINTFNIPGIDKYCYFYKSLNDWKSVATIKNKECIVIGGGASGIELAYKLSKNNNSKKVTIVEALDILPGFSEITKKLVKKDLKSKNIILLTNSKVQEVTNDNNVKVVKLLNGNIKADACIWTAGIKPHDLKPKNGSSNVFLIGDNSENRPYTAQKASQEGKYLAKYFNNNFNNKYALSNFKYTNNGKVIHTDDGMFIEFNQYTTIWLPKMFNNLINMLIEIENFI